jgi:hypothetical protein
LIDKLEDPHAADDFPELSDDPDGAFYESLRRRIIRKKKRGQGDRTVLFNIRMSPQEMAAAHKIARAVGMSVSEIMRYVLFEVVAKGGRAEEFQKELQRAALTRDGATVHSKNLPKFDPEVVEYVKVKAPPRPEPTFASTPAPTPVPMPAPKPNADVEVHRVLAPFGFRRREGRLNDINVDGVNDECEVDEEAEREENDVD